MFTIILVVVAKYRKPDTTNALNRRREMEHRRYLQSSLTSSYTGYAHVDTTDDESEPALGPLEPGLSLVSPPPPSLTVPTIKVYSASERTLTISSRQSIESRESTTDSEADDLVEEDDRSRMLPSGAAPPRIFTSSDVDKS